MMRDNGKHHNPSSTLAASAASKAKTRKKPLQGHLTEMLLPEFATGASDVGLRSIIITSEKERLLRVGFPNPFEQPVFLDVVDFVAP